MLRDGSLIVDDEKSSPRSINNMFEASCGTSRKCGSARVHTDSRLQVVTVRLQDQMAAKAGSHAISGGPAALAVEKIHGVFT